MDATTGKSRQSTFDVLKRLAACGGLVLLTSCASMPAGQELQRWAAEQDPPQAHAEPDASALKKALADRGKNAAAIDADVEYVREVSRIDAVVARRPLVGGNRVALLKDGPATHKAQLAAITDARRYVYLDMFLFTDDEIGQRYAQALSERAQAGVVVRVIVDGFGRRGASDDFMKKMRDAGVDIREFHTVNPLKDPRVWRLTRRSHRKLLIVDHRIAFTGGINITDDYIRSSRGSGSLSGSGSASGGGSGSGFSTGSRGKAARGWRDTHIAVDGPAVSEFERQFLRFWSALGDPAPETEALAQPPAPHGDEFVRLIVDQGEDLADQLWSPAARLLAPLSGRDNDKPQSRIYAAYLGAMHHARHRIWITQSYFAPNDAFIEVLEAAAKRGVDVRLLMPAESDVELLRYAAQHSYQRLLKAGIKLYEYQDTMLHAKTAVIDGVWSTVGSANLDYRSFIHNDEANAIVIGREFGRSMEQMYEDDLKNARQIDAQTWKQRPLTQKLKESFAAAIKFAL